MLFSTRSAKTRTSGFLFLPLRNSFQAANRFSEEQIVWKILSEKPPPNGNFVAPIVDHIRVLYKELYALGNRIPKRDKLGLHQHIEKLCIELLYLGIEASLSTKQEKLSLVRKMRIQTETLKYLVRVSSENKIIKENQYILLEEQLAEISKEALGWERYVSKSSPQGELL